MYCPENSAVQLSPDNGTQLYTYYHAQYRRKPVDTFSVHLLQAPINTHTDIHSCRQSGICKEWHRYTRFQFAIISFPSAIDKIYVKFKFQLPVPVLNRVIFSASLNTKNPGQFNPKLERKLCKFINFSKQIKYRCLKSGLLKLD